MSNVDRIGIMERRRALEAARNMLYSKIGKVVLDENKFPDRTLEIQVKRIDVESKKNSSLIDNDKKMFKRARLIYNLEPTIIIERPASPNQKTYRGANEDAKPSYMAATKKPEVLFDVSSMPPTIDAFTVLKRKTKNLWETKYTEEDMTQQFRSIIMKSPPLTHNEHEKLGKGYALFRPASKNEEEEQLRMEARKTEKIMLLREVQRSPSPDAQLAFITQLEQDAESRSRTSRSLRTRSGQSQTSDLSKSNQSSMMELDFNPFHLERFEKLRSKQKERFFKKMKL